MWLLQHENASGGMRTTQEGFTHFKHQHGFHTKSDEQVVELK